jgi:hypothetical protein
MKKTAKKLPRKNAKSKISFSDVIDSMTEEVPVYEEIGAENTSDEEVLDSWESVPEEPVETVIPVTEVTHVEPEPKVEAVNFDKVTQDELVDSIQKLIKIIRFLYGKAKFKVSYNPDDIAKAIRWVDAAERQLAQINKDIFDEEEKRKRH